MSTFVILSVCCVILSHFIQSFHNYCIFSQQDVYEDWMVLGEAAKAATLIGHYKGIKELKMLCDEESKSSSNSNSNSNSDENEELNAEKKIKKRLTNVKLHYHLLPAKPWTPELDKFVESHYVHPSRETDSTDKIDIKNFIIDKSKDISINNVDLMNLTRQPGGYAAIIKQFNLMAAAAEIKKDAEQQLQEQYGDALGDGAEAPITPSKHGYMRVCGIGKGKPFDTFAQFYQHFEPLWEQLKEYTTDTDIGGTSDYVTCKIYVYDGYTDLWYKITIDVN